MYAPPLLAPSPDPSTWGLIVMGVLTVVYVAVIRPMRKKKDPRDQAGPRPGLAQQRSVEREMSNLLVELEKMTHTIMAQLDTRAARLELLIQEADGKIAQLRAAQNNGHPTRDAPAPGLPATSAAPAAYTTVSASPVRVEPEPMEIDPRHAEVYDLADQGQSPHQIAQQLGRPRGEVELILALRPRGEEDRG